LVADYLNWSTCRKRKQEEEAEKGEVSR